MVWELRLPNRTNRPSNSTGPQLGHGHGRERALGLRMLPCWIGQGQAWQQDRAWAAKNVKMVENEKHKGKNACMPPNIAKGSDAAGAAA